MVKVSAAALIRKEVLIEDVVFFVPGKPQGKARARTVRTRSGRSMSYTPAKTVVYEGMIRSRFLDAVGSKVSMPVYRAGVPVRIKVQAFYKPPARTTKKDLVLIQEGKKLPLKKPDIDNILKAVCDALNGVAYKDDVQIVKTSAEKYYAHEDGLWVTVGRADS